MTIDLIEYEFGSGWLWGKISLKKMVEMLDKLHAKLD